MSPPPNPSPSTVAEDSETSSKNCCTLPRQTASSAEAEADEQVEEVEESTRKKSAETYNLQNTQRMGSTPKSRVDEIINNFHKQIQRIESLEAKIDARAVQTRRRISSLVEMPSGKRHSYRNSHLRLFITHEIVEKPRDKPEVS